jgi:hypothetical protein
MSSAKRAAFGVAAIVTAFGCGSDFDPSSRITVLRVLAVTAKSVNGGVVENTGASFARPGETVELSAVWHDPKGRPVTFAWATCVKPPSSTVLGCFQKLARDTQASGRPPTFQVGPSATFRTTIPADVLQDAGPDERAGATVGVVTIACPGRLEPVTDGSARNALPVRCLDENGEPFSTHEFVVGIKRLFLRERDRNADPEIAQVLWNGQPWPEDEIKTVRVGCAADENRFDRCGGETHELAITPGPGVVESGTDELGKDFSEQVVLQYFATEGLFEFDVKRVEQPQTKWAARAGKLGEQKIWLVLRDNRGGSSVALRRVRVE